jgi:hypothetical protein
MLARRPLHPARAGLAVLFCVLFPDAVGRSAAASAQAANFNGVALPFASQAAPAQAGSAEARVGFELPVLSNPIRMGALRVFMASGASAQRVALYAAAEREWTDRSETRPAPLEAETRLGELQIRPGRNAWYEWDVTGFLAAQAAAGRRRIWFALRSPAALQLAVNERSAQLHHSSCDEQRCKPLLGVYVGNRPRDVLAFENWLGRGVDGVLGYTGHKDWADYDGSVEWATQTWSALDRSVFWSVPLIPKKGASLARAARGAYDGHYRRAARELARFRPQDPVLYVRTAWEWNGDWFPWSVARSQTADFIAAWRRFVDVFRSVSPRFRFDWCASMGREPYPWEEAYPGDAYVDVIGVDVYDESVWSDIADPAARFAHLQTRRHGLDWLAAFAARKRRPISIAEWGVGGNGSGDNALFVERMHAWIAAHPVVYHVYWNSDAEYTGKLSSGRLPRAARTYRELFR